MTAASGPFPCRCQRGMRRQIDVSAERPPQCEAAKAIADGKKLRHGLLDFARGFHGVDQAGGLPGQGRRRFHVAVEVKRADTFQRIGRQLIRSTIVTVPARACWAKAAELMMVRAAVPAYMILAIFLAVSVFEIRAISRGRPDWFLRKSTRWLAHRFVCRRQNAIVTMSAGHFRCHSRAMRSAVAP